MRRFTRWIVVVAVLATALIAAPAYAAGPYIQINNGTTMVTNTGQTPQLVVQFGNSGSTTVRGVSISCSVPAALGTITGNYPGPFKTVTSSANSISFSSVDLIAGQNYNVSVNFKVSAAKGTTHTVSCSLASGSGSASASATVKVQ